MEPVITTQMLTAALTKALDTAAGEAGRRGWQALVEIVKRRKDKAADTSDAVEPPPAAPSEPNEIKSFAEQLAIWAAADPTLASELAGWHKNVTYSATGHGDVSSNISGTVNGPVIQARDISGPITFGR